jgi:hypothetical protein
MGPNIPDGKGQAVVARSRRMEQKVPVLKPSFTSTKEQIMSERNANQNSNQSADHSSNQIESFWMHAESERQDIMADFYGTRARTCFNTTTKPQATTHRPHTARPNRFNSPPGRNSNSSSNSNSSNSKTWASRDVGEGPDGLFLVWAQPTLEVGPGLRTSSGLG